MILKKFKKQPLEVKDYDIDYSPWLTPMGDSLDFVDTVVTCLDDPDDAELVVDSTTYSATSAKLFISGGTDGYAYKVTIRVETVGNRIDESELIFSIGDI